MVAPERARQQNILTQQERKKANEDNIESLLMQMIVRNGDVIILRDVEDSAGNRCDLNVAQFVAYSLGEDNIVFSNPLYRQMLEEAVAHSADQGFKSEEYFTNHQDVEISRVATRLAYDNYMLAEQEEERPLSAEEKREAEKKRSHALLKKVNHLLLDLRLEYIDNRLKALQQEIVATKGDAAKTISLMKQYKEMQMVRNELAKSLGSNIIV